MCWRRGWHRLVRAIVADTILAGEDESVCKGDVEAVSPRLEGDVVVFHSCIITGVEGKVKLKLDFFFARSEFPRCDVDHSVAGMIRNLPTVVLVTLEDCIGSGLRKPATA